MKLNFKMIISFLLIITLLVSNFPYQKVVQAEKHKIDLALYSISGRVTDNLGNGISGVSINAYPNSCTFATASKPVLLVTGMGGSEKKYFSNQDENLKYIANSLTKHGYIEGCNLFYAHGTSLEYTQAENAVVIRDQLCEFHKHYISKYASRPEFNIIGHSYGGLRSRAYLESDMYGTACPDSEEVVKVDNLITLGTPHGGEWGDLPLATILLLMGLYDSIAENENNIPALAELLPPVRLAQNLSSEQPNGVDYYLINGDARQQILDFNPILLLLIFADYALWKYISNNLLPNQEMANDMAVSQLSGFSLELIPWRYKSITKIETIDIHGRCDDSDLSSITGKGCEKLGINELKSYLAPSDTFIQSTFEDEIWPILYASNLGLSYTAQSTDSIQTNNIEKSATSVSDLNSIFSTPTTEGVD